jgi:rhodanese-related sulfurtransferase
MTCAHGERSMTAASILERGYQELAVVDGGTDAWSAIAGRRLITEV